MNDTPSVEPLTFTTEEAAMEFILEYGISGFAHDSGVNKWVIICLTQNGVLAATSHNTGVILEDW